MRSWLMLRCLTLIVYKSGITTARPGNRPLLIDDFLVEKELDKSRHTYFSQHVICLYIFFAAGSPHATRSAIIIIHASIFSLCDIYTQFTF
ncbi:hypothetical protein BDV29DRAFT_165811 [Aspergillus leporis]|uniref:Secreted protein n=1 Tax=Aspergillus leporis TaxID=41062 RepID=A0A5N5XDP2_9EURO|nr:hypothetical protein BDV29DRAFT_165811 [Aspergillus leporis]